MKCAYITNVLVPGGGAQSVQIEAMVRCFDAALKKRGDSFLFISSQSTENKDMQTPYEWKKVPVPRAARAWRYLPFLLQAFLVARQRGVTHVYTRDIGIALVAAYLGLRAIYEVHKPFETRRGDAACKSAVKRGVRFVAISEALSSYMREQYGIAPSHIVPAHDGVFLSPYEKVHHEEARKELRQELRVSDTQMIALYSSHLYKGKGFELIVELARAFPNVLFVVMGREHEEMNKSNLPENFRYIGFRPHEDVPRYLAGADLLLLPFTKELKTWQYHSSLKMFEYMAAGVAVIGSGIGSVKEIFSERNGFLFNPEDKDDMKKVFAFALANGEERGKRATVARREVESYTWEKRSQRIIDFLRG